MTTEPVRPPTEDDLIGPSLHRHPSGVGVVDKSVAILDALESGPATLAQLVIATGIARPTLHRLAAALTHHRMVGKDLQGRYVLGPRLAELASAAGEDRLTTASGPVLLWLRDATGESAQVFRRQADSRVCVASAERPWGLRDTIPVGARMSMKAGSAAQVLLAWEDHERLVEGLAGAEEETGAVRCAPELAIDAEEPSRFARLLDESWTPETLLPEEQRPPATSGQTSI